MTLLPESHFSIPTTITDHWPLTTGHLRDSHGRVIRDLRLSVTDRCNFRCTYCMPEAGIQWKPRTEILSLEELQVLAEIFVSLGVTKLRVTGGEALLRRNVVSLIRNLAKLPGVEDLALTTNGFFLKEFAADLAAAGLRRVTISLDSLDRKGFQNLTKVDALDRVLESIGVAQTHGLTPLKVNCVIIKDFNDREIEDFAAFARDYGVSMRFIEYMPLDGPGEWSREMVYPGRDIHRRINALYPLERVAGEASETARKYRFADGAPGEIGIIAPVTEPFCGACSRIRLTADGKIRTCLFSTVEYDVRDALRAGASRADLVAIIRDAVAKKEPGHRINQPDFVPPSRTMSCIGG